MAYYYVYCPFSGASHWGTDCYCGTCDNGNACNNAGNCTACGAGDADCTHNSGITGLCCPVDIGGGANVSVKCYVSSNIRSIRTKLTGPNNDGDLLCGTAPPAAFAWVNEGVKVELYCGQNATGTFIGTVFYGHVRNRQVQNNVVYNYPHGKLLGYLGNLDCCTCQTPCANPVPNNCKCACYKGIHVHMERSSTNGYTYKRNCNTGITTSSPMYRWTGPDICPV